MKPVGKKVLFKYATSKKRAHENDTKFYYYIEMKPNFVVT